jgi:hypothetical protein
VVQIRAREWLGSRSQRRRSYGVALHFALPGVMSLVALVDPQDPAFWRVSFAVVALGGAIVVATVGGPSERVVASRTAARSAAAGPLGFMAYTIAIALYVLVGALAVVGGANMLRVEALLLIALAFLGFNAAWLLLLDDARPGHAPAPSDQPASAADAAWGARRPAHGGS